LYKQYVKIKILYYKFFQHFRQRF